MPVTLQQNDADPAVPVTQRQPIERIDVRPWPDKVIDALGHDPRSPYVERFWLPILGPSACWLLRRLAAGLESEPAGFVLDVAAAARSLGLGNKGGRNAPLIRTIARTDQFHLSHFSEPEASLMVRRKLPPLNRGQVTRLPTPLQLEHARWLEHERLNVDAERRTRARRLALSLFELGEDAESTERQLGRWRYHPLVCRDATAWALDRHRRALEAVNRSETSEPEPAA